MTAADQMIRGPGTAARGRPAAPAKPSGRGSAAPGADADAPRRNPPARRQRRPKGGRERAVQRARARGANRRPRRPLRLPNRLLHRLHLLKHPLLPPTGPNNSRRRRWSRAQSTMTCAASRTIHGRKGIRRGRRSRWPKHPPPRQKHRGALNHQGTRRKVRKTAAVGRLYPARRAWACVLQ
jgi:hypothetical protein